MRHMCAVFYVPHAVTQMRRISGRCLLFYSGYCITAE